MPPRAPWRKGRINWSEMNERGLAPSPWFGFSPVLIKPVTRRGRDRDRVIPDLHADLQLGISRMGREKVWSLKPCRADASANNTNCDNHGPDLAYDSLDKLAPNYLLVSLLSILTASGWAWFLLSRLPVSARSWLEWSPHGPLCFSLCTSWDPGKGKEPSPVSHKYGVGKWTVRQQSTHSCLCSPHPYDPLPAAKIVPHRRVLKNFLYAPEAGQLMGDVCTPSAHLHCHLKGLEFLGYLSTIFHRTIAFSDSRCVQTWVAGPVVRENFGQSLLLPDLFILLPPSPTTWSSPDQCGPGCGTLLYNAIPFLVGSGQPYYCHVVRGATVALHSHGEWVMCFHTMPTMGLEHPPPQKKDNLLLQSEHRRVMGFSVNHEWGAGIQGGGTGHITLGRRRFGARHASLLMCSLMSPFIPA